MTAVGEDNAIGRHLEDPPLLRTFLPLEVLISVVALSKGYFFDRFDRWWPSSRRSVKLPTAFPVGDHDARRRDEDARVEFPFQNWQFPASLCHASELMRHS